MIWRTAYAYIRIKNRFSFQLVISREVLQKSPTDFPRNTPYSFAWFDASFDQFTPWSERFDNEEKK